MALLEAVGLTKHFQAKRGLMGGSQRRGARGRRHFVPDRGRAARSAWSASSGCGKTTTAKLVLGLEEPSTGSIRFQGRDLMSLDTAGRRQYRRSVQAVFQDPYASLNPRMRISQIIAEPLTTNERLTAAAVRERVLELLDLVGLPARAADLFPHEFSGGQRQRIAIARALSLSPKLIVLDEPVSALDVSIRAQILNLLRDLQDRLGLSYLFIAHDLAAVAHMSHMIVVMYLGKDRRDAARRAGSPLHRSTRTPRRCSPPRCRAIPTNAARRSSCRVKCQARSTHRAAAISIRAVRTCCRNAAKACRSCETSKAARSPVICTTQRRPRRRSHRTASLLPDRAAWSVRQKNKS